MKIFHLFFACILALTFTGCNKDTPGEVLKVAATSVPHAEILDFIKPDLKEMGINLEVIVVEDYNTPNRALADAEVDANFFQHAAFLNQQIKDFNYPLEILGPVHLEPMGLYSQKIKNLDELQRDNKIAVPSDPSNQARALELIEREGLITLRRHDANTGILDIADNPHHFKFIEIDSPLLARSLEEVDLAAITTNFALQAGLFPTNDALALEDSHSNYVNVVVIKKGDGNREDLQALIKALQSEKMRQFLEKQYKGAVIPAF